MQKSKCPYLERDGFAVPFSKSECLVDESAANV
jgi:hypothetical protein